MLESSTPPGSGRSTHMNLESTAPFLPALTTAASHSQLLNSSSWEKKHKEDNYWAMWGLKAQTRAQGAESGQYNSIPWTVSIAPRIELGTSERTSDFWDLWQQWGWLVGCWPGEGPRRCWKRRPRLVPIGCKCTLVWSHPDHREPMNMCVPTASWKVFQLSAK